MERKCGRRERKKRGKKLMREGKKGGGAREDREGKERMRGERRMKGGKGEKKVEEE